MHPGGARSHNPTDAFAALDLVDHDVELSGRHLSVLRPRDSEALLDEGAFEQEEFLPYWAELWPSGVALAKVVAERDLAGMAVVELGCGLALPSFAAALAGARVVATDWSPDAVALVRHNAERNGLDVGVARCSWSEPHALLERAPWDVVLAADVLYERRNVDQLLGLLPRLVSGDSEVLIADPGRPAGRTFFAAARRDWVVDAPDVPRPGVVTIARLRRAA